MAHFQQIDFCLSVKKLFPHYFSNRLVVDIGSLDINGNNQYLFENCLYCGVDLMDGKNVDFSVKGHEFHLPNGSVDVIISTECFEHDRFYSLTLKNIVRMLRPGGMFMFTCATTGRPEHGTSRSNPEDAPYIQSDDEWKDYYKNLEEDDVRTVLDVELIFEKYQFSINDETHDLYFWGVKKGILLERQDYSFQIAKSEHDAKLANLKQALTECKEQISEKDQAISERDQLSAELNQNVSERDSQITDLNQNMSERDSQITDLNQNVSERDRQIADLEYKVDEREQALNLVRRELAGVIDSSTWKMTWPLRYGVEVLRSLIAHQRILQSRVRFVIRQEGVYVFARRTIGYIVRWARRKVEMWRTLRSLSDNESMVRDENTPLVSFVIPIYDRTDVLRTAVQSALVQSAQVFEVILVTDGSPTDTMAVVNEFATDPRVHIYSYPVSSGNAVRGRNKGILEACGKYVAFLDSDDVAAPDRLEVCLPLLESGKADVVYGAWRALLDGSREIDGLVHGQVVHSPDCDLTMLKKICVPCQSTVMVRREMLLRNGFLKPCMQYREDHELWARLAYHGAKFKSVPHVLTDLRLHSGNNELNFKDNDTHWENMLAGEYRLPGPIPKKIGFLVGGLGISGGLAVALKHVSMLMEEGHDAFVIDLGGYGDIAWYGNPAIRVYRMEQITHYALDNIDLLIATFWTTVSWLEKIPARRKLYMIQSDERLFYEDDSIKAQIADTYRQSYECIVIAQWLVDLLREEFGKSATYIPNGLDSGLFYPGDPLVAKHPQRFRVLIEGPISVPFKGVAEAYAAISELDCELWIVSSEGKPESSWRYDRFFTSVKLEEMRRIYSSCHVLLKMSHVESFAYPPLEAMACGCAVVLGEVNGGIEYARDGENVLLVPQGDVVSARIAVQKLQTTPGLMERLVQAGFETVKHWSWDASRESMLALVEEAERE